MSRHPERNAEGLFTIDAVLAKFKDGARIYSAGSTEAMVVEPGEDPVIFDRVSGEIRHPKKLRTEPPSG